MNLLKVCLSANKRLLVLEVTNLLSSSQLEYIQFKRPQVTVWMDLSNFYWTNKICVLFYWEDILYLYLYLCWILMVFLEDIVGWTHLIKIWIVITALLILRDSHLVLQLRSYVSTIQKIKDYLCIWIFMLIQLIREISFLVTQSMNLLSR
jgi:hypothetical protein